jgi:cytoskeletal protein RodZ
MALREARVAKEITLEDLQEKTKIQKRYLQAIEEGNFDRLPGHFYTRAFIKSYAEAVGLDSSLIFETYQSVIPKTGGPDEEALPPRQGRESIRTPNDSNWSSRLPRVATVVIILLIAIGVWYLAKHFINGNDSSVAKSKQSGLSYHTPKDIGNGKKAAPKKQANTATPKKNAGTSTDQAQTNSATTQKIDLTQSSGSNFTYTLSGTNKFDLSVSAPKGKSSWVEIYDTSASGKKFYYGNVSNTGTSPLSFHQDLSNLKQVYMKIGNVLNADVTINGQKLDLSKGPVFQHITIIYKK